MGSIAIKSGAPRDIRASVKQRDFSKPWLFDLNTRKPDKTIDIGGHGLSLSLDALGRVLQASTYHPECGVIMANSFEQFDGTRYYDVPYVRSYRTRMLQSIKQNRPGFGLDFGIYAHHVSIRIIETNVALYHLTLANNVELLVAVKVAPDGSFTQTAHATNHSADCLLLPYALSINLSINRASYGQLTEGGPVPLPASRNVLDKIDATTLRVSNPNLEAQFVTRLDINGQPLVLNDVEHQEVCGRTLSACVKGKVCIPPGESATFCASFRLLPDTERYDHILAPPQSISHDLRSASKSRWKDDQLLTTYVVRRNVDYILGNCVLPVSDSIAVVVTDHVALPLGWNRDNYWQVRLLLETYAHAEDLVSPPFILEVKDKIKSTVRGHLNWVFTRAERPNGYWQRSYLANGKPKDRSIFQLDQQCYPLLELCDYLEYFPEDLDFTRRLLNTGVVEDILAVLASKQDPVTQLWPTDETPGDDAVIYPHHFSSHVLLWRTYARLGQLYLRANQDPIAQVQELSKMAAQVKDYTLRAFSSEHPCHGRIFAYLTDGCGDSTFYHDANDVPTAFAKEWAFVSTFEEISIWESTMRFGISSANESGYCNDSPYGGLGSVHSPGAWTLGYFQELFVATSVNDVHVMRNTWQKIAAAMQWDGTFPEAVDATTGECTSKAWFSWPGAMIGALLIRLKMNGQEKVLLQ